jgi:hypothetical protein
LPQIETDGADFVSLVQVGVSLVLRVVDLRVNPHALVGRVVDLLWLPVSLVVGVVDHGGFPFAVHLIVPVLGLLSLRVGNVLGLLPVSGFGVVGVVNGGALVPILRLLGFGVLDLLGRQEVPVSLKLTTLNLLIVDENLITQMNSFYKFIAFLKSFENFQKVDFKLTS